MASRATDSGPLSALPGFGNPLDYYSLDYHSKKCYPTALIGYYEAALLTMREYTMMELMNRITDKPNWEMKVFDVAIAARWKAEALAMIDKDISEKMVDWVGQCIASRLTLLQANVAVQVHC